MSKAHASGLLLYRVEEAVKFLLLRASYGEKHWTPPKGHLDPGEDELTAALRETQEECGLKPNQFVVDEKHKQVISYKVKGKEKVVSYYLAELKDKNATICLSDEHIDYGWFLLNDAIECAKYDGLRKVIRDAASYINLRHNEACS